MKKVLPIPSTDGHNFGLGENSGDKRGSVLLIFAKVRPKNLLYTTVIHKQRDSAETTVQYIAYNSKISFH